MISSCGPDKIRHDCIFSGQGWNPNGDKAYKEENISESVLSSLFGEMKKTKSRRGKPSIDRGWAWMILVGKRLSLDSVENNYF